jgi:hypothetical protein
MKSFGTVVVTVNIGAPLAPKLVRELGSYFHTNTDVCALGACSFATMSFLKALASTDDALEGPAVANVMKVSPRSLPPILKAAQHSLARYGDSFDNYVVRHRVFRQGKPHTRYELTTEGRKRITELNA